jgi:predicted TIM-barrel fold metal-dependent hydrolase
MPTTTPGDAPYTIVSIDSHVSPLFSQLREYCPAAHRERFDEWSAWWLGLWGDDHNWYAPTSPISSRWGHPFTPEVRRRTGELVERAGAGVHDAAARVRDMDGDGIAAELVYHTAFTPEVMPFQGGTVPGDDDRTLEAVGIEMYNRWLADFVGEAPERLIGSIYVPIWDVDASVAQVRWGREHGLRCVNFPAPHRSAAPYNDPVYEPFWAACAELDLPLTTHGGAGDMPEYTGKEAWALYSSDLFYYSRRGFQYLCWAGVFERYPTLKMAFTEQRSTWVVDTLAELDSVWLGSYQDLTQLIPRRPSEYFREHCYLGVSFMSHFEAERRAEVGVDRLMWGSDYPHFEGTWGYTLESLRATFSDVPVDEVRQILGGTAIELFGLDATRLDEIAAPIGPTPAQIAEPLEQVPDIPGLSFRQLGSWA